MLDLQAGGSADVTSKLVPYSAEKNLETYGSLVEPFGASIGDDSGAPPFLSQMGPAIVGLQAGSLVGSLATWVVASFDAGLPQTHPGPLSLIISNIADMEVEGVDTREVHLWVVANEVAFRAVSQLPWIHDHLADLVGLYADAAKIDPTKLSGLMLGGTDPTDIERAIEDAGGILITGSSARRGQRRQRRQQVGGRQEVRRQP